MCRLYEKEIKMNKKIITITVEGGVIQSIDDIPEDIEVHVKDFDCDSEPGEESNIQRNEDGDCYWFSVWSSKG